MEADVNEPSSSQHEIIANYADGPKRLEAAIAGLSATDLDFALSSNSWTIRQIVHHLADGDDLWKAFVKQAIGNPGSEFVLEWYWQMPQDEWVKRWAYGKRAIEPSLALYRASRFHIVQLLEHTPEVWDKSLRIRGPHGDEQGVSVRWVVEMQTRHIEDHLNEIREIRKAHRI
jgi:hypothetical protein